MKKTEPGFINLLLSFVGSLLRASLRDIDIVSFDLAKNQYVVLLPETTLAKAERPVGRLNEMSLKQTGVSLLVGMAEFPTDGLIIEDLVNSAEGNCRRLSIGENGRGLVIKDKPRSHSPQTIMQP
jgi:GGDEF domain-containing protein